MASYVYFKFMSQKEPQRITIDGPHTDVWNLKREIILVSRLGDGTDFDLKIYKENGGEEYTDDTEIIPKDSTVLARRAPATNPGKGRAARYVSGKPPVSAKPSANASKMAKIVDMDKAMTEQERLQAMFKFTDAQWQQKQEEMSHETRVPMQGLKPFQKKGNVPEGDPPHGYICYRCGKKGHWIQACPTNDDANYDNRNRIKRTTGIPRSMLKKIDQSDIDKLDEVQRQNLMVNAEGEYVFAQADEKAWKKHLAQVKAAEAAQRNAKVGGQELRERGLECPIDKRLFVDPMKTPCCGRTFCHDCIENALLENDLTCPGCDTENVSLERLEPDEEVKGKIKEYQNEKSSEKQRSQSPAASVGTPQADETKANSDESSRNGSKSPVSTSGQSKKRSADEANEIVSPTLSAPAMKRQKSGEGSSTPQTVSSKLATTSETPGTPRLEDNSSTNDSSGTANNMFMNMMPPDLSQMTQMMQSMQNMQNMPNMGMPFQMPGMPAMPGMPFMPMPNMMNMNGMPAMNMMPNMPFMPAGGFNNNNNNNWNQSNSNSNTMNGQNFQNRPHQNKHKQKPFQQYQQTHQQSNNGKTQPPGMAGVPTGPKALHNKTNTSNNTGASQPQNPNENNTNNNGEDTGEGSSGGQGTGFYPPTGPSATKFSNQQRHTGKEEENAYMRQPVNPHRHMQRNNRRGRAREADYREL